MCLYKVTSFYGSVFGNLSTSLHVCTLSEKRRKSWEGFTVIVNSKFFMVHFSYWLIFSWF